MRPKLYRMTLASSLLALTACGVAGPGEEQPSEAWQDGCEPGECDPGKGDGLDGPGGGRGSGGSSSGGDGACYDEGYDLAPSLADLKSSYRHSKWLPTLLSVLERRYADGYSLMSGRQSSSWLLNSFPQYANLSSWQGLMEGIHVACHEETHGWDFDASTQQPGSHVFYMGAEQHISAPELDFFPRHELLGYVQVGGSVTGMYDSTYLTGYQGNQDFVFLADEINAYTADLACATVVGDELDGGNKYYSYRDGIAAHLLYLLYYLRHARTKYPALYSRWQAEPGWQSFIRLAWARAAFWTDGSSPYASLGIRDEQIWARIRQPTLLAEIERYTGEAHDTVACNP